MSNTNRTHSSRNDGSGRSNMPNFAGVTEKTVRGWTFWRINQPPTPGLGRNPHSQPDVRSTDGQRTHLSRTGSRHSRASDHPSHHHNRDRNPAERLGEDAAHARAYRRRHEDPVPRIRGNGIGARIARWLFEPKQDPEPHQPLLCDIVVAERHRREHPDSPPPGQPRYHPDTPQPQSRADWAAAGYRGRRPPRNAPNRRRNGF